MPVCPTCSSLNPDGSRFCNTCGSELGAPRPVEGERRFATVLFADVVRSTALAEGLDPEDWAAIMNGAFGFMNGAITRFGGTVARLMGDAVLAFFGAPVAHEDDAERAVRAALALQESAAEYARTVGQRYGIDFEVRVGINTGTSVLALVGDAVKAEYTSMGDTANVAARLQSEARPGTVLISDDTARLVKGVFELESRGPVELKGKQEAVDTYEVAGVRSVPGPSRGVEGLASPLVGRDAEMASLRERLAGLREGQGAVVALVGDAGIGKSRLVAEAREAAAAAGVAWYEGRAVSYGSSLAYYPWQQLGRQLIGASEPEGGAAVRERLASFAEGLGLASEHLPLLETMLAVETAESRGKLEGVDGDALVQRIADAVISALRSAVAKDGGTPHVLVFDDLHWSDAASLELIAQVATITAGEPLLLLCVLRPERRAGTWALLDRLEGSIGPSFLRLDLGPLDGELARELLGNLLHIEDLPEDIRSLILERSEGNPFFLEEVLRSLIDSGHVVRDNGRWRATEAIVEVSIPDTLAGVLAARIDRLPEPTKRVAQTASVLGRIFGYRALTTVCRSAPPPERIENVDPHLGTLTYEELVRERTRDPEREYIFKHALTQEAAYELLLKARRRELHGRVGRVLEELYADRLEEVAPVLARHFSLAGDAERTARYAMQAAERAVSLYALTEAEVQYERAYTALGALDEPPVDRLLDAILGWAVVRYKLANYDDVVERLHEAEAMVREADDKPRLARILSWISLVYMVKGFPSRSGPYMRESAELARSLGMDELLLLPFFFATETLVDRDPRQAVEQFGQVIALAREHGMPEIEGHALASASVAHARLGHFERARALVDQALSAASHARHPVKEADVHLIVANTFYELGEVETGLRHARLGAELAQAKNALECVCAGYYAVGMGELERRELDRALRSFDLSREVSDQVTWSGWSGYTNRIRAGTATIAIEKGSREAVPELEQAIENARSEHDDYGVATGSERLARVFFADEELDLAAERLADALEFYRTAGMKPYEARALELEARIHEAAGRPAEAERARSHAAELRRTLDLAPANP